MIVAVGKRCAEHGVNLDSRERWRRLAACAERAAVRVDRERLICCVSRVPEAFGGLTLAQRLCGYDVVLFVRKGFADAVAMTNRRVIDRGVCSSRGSVGGVKDARMSLITWMTGACAAPCPACLADTAGSRGVDPARRRPARGR